MKNLILILLMVCLMAANATAAVTSEFESVVIPAGGVIPGGIDYVTNTWNINTDTGDGWLNAGLYVNLTTTGNIYQDAGEINDVFGNDIPPAETAVGTSLEYDSYMTGGYDTTAAAAGTTPLVVGNAYELSGAGPSSTAEFSTSAIDATWVSSLIPTPSGEFMLARVTLSDDAVGTYKFRVGLRNGGEAFFYGGEIAAGVMGGLPTQPEPPLPGIPGDADLDGDVDADDATILATNWQTLTGATWGMGDFNRDGNVNDLDATLMAANWGTGVAAAAVPEPGALSLIMGAILALGLFRRR